MTAAGVPEPVARDGLPPRRTTGAGGASTGPADDRDTLTVLHGMVKIRRAPRWDAPLAGLIRAGQTVRLRDPAPVSEGASGGCPEGWRAIAPHGFVCHGPNTTVVASTPAALAAAEGQPDRSADYPFHYGVALGAPRYTRFPTAEQRRQYERWPDAQSSASPTTAPSSPGAAPSSPATAPSSPAAEPALPRAALREYLASRSTLRDPLDAYPTMKLAWARELREDGRRYLLTPELLLVPAERVTVAPEVRPLGVMLERRPELRLPFAIIVKRTPRLAADGTQQPGHFERGDVLRLALPCSESDACSGRADPGAPSDARGHPGRFVSPSGEAVATTAAVKFEEIVRPAGIGADEKWVLVRVNAGSLVALEGDRPVFAAPISAGVHGVSDGPFRTNPGRYRISSKSLTADMGGEADQSAWRSREVPWVAYYDGSYALHGAWWHNDFGRPRSRGCVNLTPGDARWLFEWLEPALPDGWYGIVAALPQRPGTLLVVRR